MDEKELKLLWESLSKDFDIGEFDYFKSKMSDESGRKKFYDAFSSDVDGAKALKSVNPKFSDFSQFNVYVGGLKKKEPAVSGQPSVVSGSTSPSPSQFQLPSVDPAKEPEDNLYDLNQAVTKEADNVYAQSQAKINLLTKDYEDYVAQLNQQIKDGVIDNFTAQGLLGHKKKRIDGEMEAANAAYQQAIEQLNSKSQEERKKILNPKNRKTFAEAGVNTSEGENAALLNEIYDLTKELDSFEDGSRDKERISQALKQKKTQLSGRLGIPEEGLEPAIAGQIYSNTIGKAPNPQEIREYEVGIKESPVNTSSTQQRRKSGQLFYENLYDYYQKNPKAASKAFSETFMDLPDQTGTRKPSQYDFEMVDFMIKNGKEAVRDEQGVLYVPEGAKDVDVKALQSQYVIKLKGLSQQATEKFIKLTPSGDDKARLEAGLMTKEAFNKKYNYENITKNLQKQLDLVNQYVLDDKDKSQISDYVKNSYTYIADVTGRFGGKEYREKNPLYAGLNDYQKIYLEGLRISDPETYENRLRLLTTPPELVKQETGTWNPELQMGYEKMMKDAEDYGIRLSGLDYLSRIENLVSKDKRGELDAEGKLGLTELMSQYDELQKFKNSQIDRYPAAAKQEIIDNIGRATGDTELGLGGQFVYGIGSGISTGIDWLYEKITAPFSDEDSRISDLETIGNDELYQSKMNKGWEDESAVEGLYKYAIDPEFKKQVDAIDADAKLNQQQKYDAKVNAFEKYRKDKGESPVVVTKNPNAGDVNLSATAILNTTSDVAQQILSQLALAYMTGGLGNVSKVRSLATLFGTTFATTIDRYEAEALKEGRTNATYYAIRKATIDALTELYGDDLMQVKNLFKGKGAVGKIINSVTEAEWKAVLSARKGLFNKVKNVVGQIPKKVLKPALTETFEEGTAQILNQALDGKDLFDGMKETLVTTAVGTIGTFLTGLPFAFRSINNSQKVKLYNAGINADKYLASVKSQLDNGQIDAKEAQKRELVINDIKNIVDNMVRVDENGKPLSDQKLIDLAFNKYVELQAQKAKKENPKSAKLDQVVDELQDENAQILSGEAVTEVKPEVAEAAPEVKAEVTGEIAPEVSQPVLKISTGKFADVQKADEAVNKIKELGVPNELNEKQVVIDGVKVEAVRDGGKILLKDISAIEPGKGSGTKVLNKIKEVADSSGVDIILIPTQIGNVSEADLIKWYKNNGFEDYTQGRLIYKTGEVAPEVSQPTKESISKEIADLRAEEQAEYAAMPDPKDEAKRKEIYDKYDKLITPLLEKEKEVAAAAPKVQKFGLGFAPFREKNVFTEREDLDIRNSPDYKLHQENVQKVAEGLGIKINNKLDTWGGYVDFQTGRPVQEVSNMMEIEATPQQARLMAAILGKAAPEMQDSILVGNYSEKGAGLQHTVKTGSFANAQEALKLLKDNGLEYFSVDKNTGDVIIIDQKSTDTPKIINLVKQLNENGIPAKHKFGKVDAEFVDSGQYDRIIEAERGRVGAETGFDIDAFVQEAAGKYDAIKAAAKPVVPETQQSISEKIRGLKIDLSKLGSGGAQSNIAGLPVALYNTVVEAVALAVEAGVSINKAIKDAIVKYNLDRQEGFNKPELVNAIAQIIGADLSKSVSDIDVNEVRTKSRPGKKVSKGLAVYTKNKQKVVEEAEELSLDYVKKNAPEVFISNANIIANYPIVKGVKEFGKIKTLEQAQEVYDIFVNQVSENLKYLMSEYKLEYRDIATLWYDGANIIAQDFANKYNITEEQAAGIIASLSPQKDWYQNVRLAEMVMMAFTENPTFTGQMINKQKSIIKEGERLKLIKIKNAELKYKSSRTKSNAQDVIEKKKAHEDYMRKAANVMAMIESYEGKTLNEVPDYIKPYVVRLSNEINTTKDYDVLSPDGKVIGTAMNDDGKTKAKVAWGSYTEIGKAVSIYLNGSQENITRTLGEMHKIRNFYNNIIDPMSKDNDVTMDTHAVAAALLLPLSGNSKEVGQNFGTGTSNSGPLGIKGLYYAFAEGYKKAAEDSGLLPRQVQSITWEAVRGLFTDTFKRNKAEIAKIKDIWSNYENGKIDINETRKQITESAGGINDPSWAESITGRRGLVQTEFGEGARAGGVEGGRGISERAPVGAGPREVGGERGARAGVEKAVKTVRSLKIKQQGLQANIAGIPIALYNTALETIALAMEAGASLKDAIDQAIQKHKLNKQKGFNAEKFIKPLEDATGQTYPKVGGKYAVQIEAAGEVPVQPEAGVSEEVEGGVPPTEPPKPPKEGEVEGEEGEVTRKPSGIKKGLVSQEILSKMNLEKVGDKELLESGRKIIDSGEVNPPSLVNKILDEGKGVLTPAEVVALITYKADLDNKQEDLAKEIGKREASGEDLGTLLADMKTLQTEIDNFDMAAVITAQQQSMSFRLRRYMLDRSYNITVQIEKYKRANNGVIPAEVEKKFREMDAQIKELDKKLKEAEASKYDQEGKAAMENIIEDVQREQANGPVLYTEAELEEKIQKGVQAEIDKIYSAMPTPKRSAAQRAITALENIQKKLRSKTYDASLGIPVAFIDAGITAIKNAIKLGIEVEKAVEIGIKTIKDKLQGKAWAKEDDFRKDMIDGFKAEGVSIKAKKTEPKINDDGTVTIPNQLIRDLVAQGITDIDDLANAVRKIVEPQLPGVTNRQVRDYITKYGKEVNPTRDDLTIKMNTAKRIGRLLSRLEDMQKMGAAVYMIKYRTQKPSGNKLTQKEQELKKLINQLEKDAIGSDEILKKIQEQKDLDAAKAAIRRRIDELSDKIARNDFSKKAKKQVPADQELRDLQSEKEKVKEEYDKAQYEAEQKNKSLGRKINDALNELLVGLARTLVTGFDFGVILTQGVIKFYRNPVMSAKAFAEGMRQFASESRQKKFENELRASGAYELIKNSGLAVSVGEERASVQEQIFIANYVNIIWNTLATIVTFNHKRSKEFVKALNPFKASQRFMDAYLNYIRINTFLDISSSISKDGYPPEVDPDLHKAAAEWVNTTTMKGAKNIPRGLGFLMFSASKVAAELKLFSPLVFAYYAQMPAPLRKRAILDYGKFALSFLAVTSLMRAALGDDDDDDFWDITSSNFLTFKFGDQRLSFAAGIRPMLVFWGRLFTGRYVDQYGEVSKLGERPGKDVNTKGDLIFRFFISKFAPVPAAVWSKLDERAGREVEDDVLITKLVVPMWLQDSKELYENNPREIGALYTMLSLIGANVRTVESPFKKEQKVGKTITYTDEYSRKRKIELNEEQHKEYQRIFDEIYAKNIEEIKQSSSYKNKSGEQKITFESAFSRKAKSDAESDAQKLLEKIYKNEFKKFPIIRETPEEKEVNRILNRGEKR